MSSHTSSSAPSSAVSGSSSALVLDAEGVGDYLREVWPEAAEDMAESIEVLEPGFARLRTVTGPADLRPGGTVSGPTLMAMVDTAGYVLVLGHIGPAALAVTSHISVDFLRRPVPGTLITDVELLKLGRSQITMAVRIRPEPASAPPVAVATIVYSRALVGGEPGR